MCALSTAELEKVLVLINSGHSEFGGGSLMMRGCMTWEGPGYACKIDGRMDADLYCKIMEDDLQGTLNYYGKSPGDVVFQQDNDPKHTSRKAQPGSKTMVLMS